MSPLNFCTFLTIPLSIFLDLGGGSVPHIPHPETVLHSPSLHVSQPDTAFNPCVAFAEHGRWLTSCYFWLILYPLLYFQGLFSITWPRRVERLWKELFFHLYSILFWITVLFWNVLRTSAEDMEWIYSHLCSLACLYFPWVSWFSYLYKIM